MTLSFDTSKKQDVVALGRATIDLYSNEIGLLENATTFSKYVGGSPANTAVAMARLGLKVGYIGKVSNDGFGRYIISYLSNNQIDVSHIATALPGIRSGVTIGEILHDTCHCFVYRTNCADLQINCTQLDESFIAAHKMLLISGTSLSHSPAREAVFLAIDYAKRNNTRICLDLDYRDETWDNSDETAIYFSLAAEKSDFVIGTREEFNYLERLSHPGNSDNDKSAQWLLQKGVKLVSIKEGKKGSFVYDGKQKYQGGIYPTKVLKSFGAGDSYSGALNWSLIHGKSIPEALKYAAAASSITITGHSCSDAMPTKDQLEKYIKTHQYVIH